MTWWTSRFERNDIDFQLKENSMFGDSGNFPSFAEWACLSRWSFRGRNWPHPWGWALAGQSLLKWTAAISQLPTSWPMTTMGGHAEFSGTWRAVKVFEKKARSPTSEATDQWKYWKCWGDGATCRVKACLMDGRVKENIYHCEISSGSLLSMIDESHMTMGQIKGIWQTGRARKCWSTMDSICHLPWTADHFVGEFESHVHQIVYVSATPGDYEMTNRYRIIEQSFVDRLLDPWGWKYADIQD